MTTPQATSATRFGRVVWDGANVASASPSVLTLGSPTVQVASPPAIAGVLQFGTAAFGPALGSPSISGLVVAAVDAVEAGGASTDGRSPLTNAGAVAGRIALIERGLCGFAVKARMATDAGAIGVIVYNQASNVNAAPPGMADDGINGAFVTIPTVSVRRADDADGVVDDEDCNGNSDRRPTIILNGIDTGVPNTLFASGCTSSDLIAQIDGANHGGFVSAVAHLTNEWVAAGVISGQQKGAVQSAAAKK